MKRRLAQLVERLPYKQNVTGSSPVLPSNSSICESTSCMDFVHVVQAREVYCAKSPSSKGLGRKPSKFLM